MEIPFGNHHSQVPCYILGVFQSFLIKLAVDPVRLWQALAEASLIALGGFLLLMVQKSVPDHHLRMYKTL